MPRILLSYRRDDSAAYAGRIADRLRQHFGAAEVFVDVEAIKPGEDFVDAVDASLRSCDVVVAVIGRGWLSATDDDGRRRLDRDDDFVRLEIARALERNIRVVPALVGDAEMPQVADLPPALATLTRRQAIEISDTRFHQDVDRLIAALAEIPPGRHDARALRDAPAAARSPTVTTVRGLLSRPLIVGLVAASLVAAGYWIGRQGGSSGADPSLPGARGGAPAAADAATPGRQAAPPQGALRQAVDEVEPNDDIPGANPLGLGARLNGRIHKATDKDFFRIRTPPGKAQELRVVLSNMSKLQPAVEVWNSRFESVASDYSPFGDVYLRVDAEPSSDYFVEVRFIAVNRALHDPKDSGDYGLTVLAVDR